MKMVEQMVETRAWKGRQYRGCFQHREIVKHIVAGCKVLAIIEYLLRHKRAI